MASSMLTGERRWVSARRGGMTVLGKVAVPKPVNLPSQRLENHGLDPSVEIVPKGTLSWGSRSSSSVLNAWGTPSSPTTDGSVGSPRHLSGHPSSGGSGTRPSTAGSDQSHEPGCNAWGPNSRPLSSSGVLASNQTSAMSSRPRSAETRPGSSQLSRFAEPTAENSVAWGRPETAERLGSASSRVNAFTLSSGDFPTLGSEKDSESHIQQGHSSHGHPTSDSGGAEAQKKSETSQTEDGPLDARNEKGTVNSGKSESSFYLEGGGPPPSMDHWQRDPQRAQSYTVPNMPPHHFDPWHGTPIQNPPEGVWYRGRPPGGPYGHAGPPGTYPLEPFGYYHSQGPLPARPVPASQAVPRQGGPGGYHPKNGDTFRPCMSDSYVVPSQPVMPIRQGVYPGPMPYNGYYGSPRVNFCNPNERDAPIRGMGGGPCVYNRYPKQNVHPDSGNFHVGPGGYGPTTGMSKEQRSSGHAHDTHGRAYKVLLKQHDSWGENDTEGKRESSVMTSGTHVEKGQQPETPEENYWEADERQDEQVNISKSTFAEEVFQSKNSWGGHLSDPVVVNLSANPCKIKPVDDSFIEKLETVADLVGSLQQFPAMKKNSTLINKIEGLNNKARNSDGRNEVGLVSSREENTKGFGNMDVKTGHYTNEVGPSITGSTEKASTGSTPCTASNELTDASAGDKARESSVTGRDLPRASEPQASAILDSLEVGEKARSQIHKSGHEMLCRADYRGKGQFNIQDSEEWRKKPPGADSLVSFNVSKSESSGTCLQDVDTSQEAPERQELNFQGQAGQKSYVVTTPFDSCDYKSQRAKMKEIATQRAKQLQKEEEERTREQKAKALAKLEELNRRTLVENSVNNTENNSVQHKQEESQTYGSPKTSSGIGDLASGCELGKNSDAVTQTENLTSRLEEATTTNAPSEASSCTQDSLVVVDSSLPSSQNASASSGFAVQATAPQIHGNGFSKHKQMGKRKQNISEEKNLFDKVVPGKGTKAEGNVIVSENTFEDSTLQPKKKNGHSVRNKYKLDEVSQGTDLSPPPATDGCAVKDSPESGKGMSSESVLEAGSIHTEEKVEVVAADQGWSQQAEEVHGRQNNQRKPQHPKRIFRSTQATRPSEKLHASEGVIWAPVRLPSKSGWVEEAGQNKLVEGNYSSAKNAHAPSNNLKSKRAEMERYVPKPVAKELSQHENPQQASLPSKQEISDEMRVKAHNGSQVTKSSGADTTDASRGGFASDTKNADSNKHNKHGKTHTSWRQRGAAEYSTVVEGPHKGSSSSGASKIVPKPVDQDQFSKADAYSPEVQAKYSDNTSNVSQVSTEAVAVPVDIKDHAVSGRGKRHLSKLHRGMGHNNKLSEGEMAEKTDTHLPSYGSREVDGRSVPQTESQGTIEHAACHWQPKSQTYQAHSQQGNRGSGVQRVQQQTPEKDFTTQVTGRGPARADKESFARVQSHFPRPENCKANAAELINALRQETKKGAKYIDSSRGQPHFSNQGPPSMAELAPETADGEVTVSSGVRRHGRQNGHFNRGQEASHGIGRGPAHGNNKQQVPANGDRQKHNSHFEYQPIGSRHKSNNTHYPNSVEGEERENSRITGLKYYERGQNHSKRSGHFYGRNAGSSVPRVATAAAMESEAHKQ